MASLDKIERALQARRLVEDGEFKRAFDKLRSEYIDELLEAKTVDDREFLHHRIKAMDALVLELVSVITTGEIEAQKQG